MSEDLNVRSNQKFYSMLLRSSNLQHSLAYAERYRQEDDRAKNEVSHSGKCSLIRELSDKFGRSITALDLGCGTGRYFHCFSRVRQLVAVDSSINMLKMARDPVNQGTTNVELIQGSVFDIEFKAGSFDMVACVGVFGAVCPLDSFILRRIANFIKPGGALFLTIPEYVPTKYTWRRRLAEIIEPYLFGQARRLVALRLRRFNMTEQRLWHCLSESFAVNEISRWHSPSGRVDLHAISRKQP